MPFADRPERGENAPCGFSGQLAVLAYVALPRFLALGCCLLAYMLGNAAAEEVYADASTGCSALPSSWPVLPRPLRAWQLHSRLATFALSAELLPSGLSCSLCDNVRDVLVFCLLDCFSLRTQYLVPACMRCSTCV